jgi:heme/copper-type cytochrome/quinol oxidase subunit 4
MVKSLRITRIQAIAIVLISILAAIATIIHGVFIDLDITQIKRLTLESFIITLIVAIPAILILEWVFDINNKIKLDDIEKRLKKLEKKF